MLTAKEFSEGFSQAASELIFEFATSLISSCHTEVVTLYELVVRVLMARLESKPSTGKSWKRVDSALGLLKTLVEKTNMANLANAIIPQLNEMQKNFLGTHTCMAHLVDDVF